MRTSPNAPEAVDAVVTRGLTRRFGETVVVDQVDLAVPHGVVFGLLGPNGAGPAARRDIWKELRDVNTKEATTLFITTHDMEEADALCHRVAIMHRGRVVAQGSPDELKAQVGPEASLDDVFIAYSGQAREVQEGGLRDAARARRTARRLG